MEIKKILKIPGLKYLVVLLIFAIYMVFIDDYSVVATSRLKRQVRQLHAEERELREAIVEDSLRAVEIADNPEAVERYGRENYYMKRPDEDIFVVK